MRIKKAGILIIAAAITCTTPAVPVMAADTSESVSDSIPGKGEPVSGHIRFPHRTHIIPADCSHRCPYAPG